MAETATWYRERCRLNPDGQKVAVALEDELWVSDLKRGVASPLSRDVPRVVSPTWPPSDEPLSQSFVVSPDGQRFLFARATGSDRVGVILNWAVSVQK